MEQLTEKTIEAENSFDSLKKRGAELMPDRGNSKALIVQFPLEKGVSTLRLLFNDVSGADLVITNITTLPDNEETRGYGSKALQEVLTWAKERGMKKIKAVQVQEDSEGFWIKNNFRKDPGSNECNDFTFVDPIEK